MSADAVAIVGLDCVLPGAPDADAYWNLLMRAGDAIGELPAQRRDGHGFDDTVRGGFIDDIATFDNDFFTVAPREAAAMDPQQRLLLQCAWRALEDAGQSPAALAGGDTGVFVGVMGSEWAQLHLTDPTRVTPQLGAGSSAAMTANRISYHLDLKGPSLAVDTACSSSLVAVHLAVQLTAGRRVLHRRRGRRQPRPHPRTRTRLQRRAWPPGTAAASPSAPTPTASAAATAWASWCCGG